MKRMLFLGVLISFLISGNAAAMGPADDNGFAFHGNCGRYSRGN